MGKKVIFIVEALESSLPSLPVLCPRAKPALAVRPMVPGVGLEPTTYRLQGDCSTTELTRHMPISLLHIRF